MFIDNRENLRKNIELIQRRMCSYDNFSFDPECEPPRFCDCKYGASGRGEQTGCPELRCMLVLLENMTDEEFSELVNRANPHIILKESDDET